MTLLRELEALRINARQVTDEYEYWRLSSDTADLVCKLFNNLDTIIESLRRSEKSP